jgi:hypothetical protein
MINGCEADVPMRKPEVPHFPSQIPYNLTWDRTLAIAIVATLMSDA